VELTRFGGHLDARAVGQQKGVTVRTNGARYTAEFKAEAPTRCADRSWRFHV
jgi:hypothetical protein